SQFAGASGRAPGGTGARIRARRHRLLGRRGRCRACRMEGRFFGRAGSPSRRFRRRRSETRDHAGPGARRRRVGSGHRTADCRRARPGTSDHGHCRLAAAGGRRIEDLAMSWLSRVRSGIPFLPKRQTAENLWHKCQKCGTMVFVKEWEENYSVCPRCNFHDRIGPAKRFEQLFDAAKYELLPTPEVREDPLKFRDTKRYSDRLKTARAATHERDALISAKGKIDGRSAIVSVQDTGFMLGSMGTAVGAAFVAAVERAIADRCPYIIFTAGGGARMQEGALSLMQMP